ncbi:MAG: ATP-binding protein [Nitrosomonas ureae]
MSTHKDVASPTATGGSGTFFEQHVGALFLALMLVRGIPPILKDCQIEEVHFQTAHLGWQTDDLLAIGIQASSGQRRRLAMQVKRNFTISSKNEDCRATFAGFWNDFKHNTNFNTDHDRLSLVTLRGTDALLNKFNSLLDCARASENGADFARRIAPSGYLSKEALGHSDAIKTIIEDIEGEAPSDQDYWRFLMVLHVISFDLNTPSAQTEGWINSLLAHTTAEHNPVAAATTSWHELLALASSGMPTASSYKYADLPEPLRLRHNAPVSKIGLNPLLAHSQTTLNGIHTTIAHGTSISRKALLTRLIDQLDRGKVVLLTGPAGIGKSALAKGVIELLRDDQFCLTFRAEEFATSHIDQTLQQAQSSLNAERLLALLAAQCRTVILVESVERLLEASVRDAFTDLLHLAMKDGSIQLLLTCRDYSVETVRASLLEPIGLLSSVLEVPPLTDEELSEIIKIIPSLERVIKNLSLHALLRSPYILDRAAQMDWSDPQNLPVDERAFRSKCWKEIVRRDAVAMHGMPLRREKVFLELTGRRARALSPYVQCDDLDLEALEALRKDDLIVVSSETSSLAAPAHDVLEDWAIIQWLAGQFLIKEGNAKAIETDIGGYPAIRRSFRKWLSEMLECDTKRADIFVLSCFSDVTLPAYFRDDTITSTLLSSSAACFLGRQHSRLLAEQGLLLLRVIHLLRVACKAPLRWLAGAISLPSQLLVPKGEAWPAVLKIVSEGLDKLLPNNLGLLVGLLEDWALLIEWNAPDPQGFNEAGKVAYGLLNYLHEYRTDDLRKRVLILLLKMPRANSAGFQDLIERGCKLDRQDSTATEFVEILLPGMNGYFACRDFPEHMARLITIYFCLPAQGRRRGHEFSSDIGPFFGIRDHGVTDYFPASAIRGPFLPLLRTHPRIGFKSIIDLLNHSGIWYGERRWLDFRLESAWQITLDVPGEGQVTQWANPRLWCLFRGISVGPYVLQTALMALESWLLEISKMEGVDLEPWLLKLIKESNNVAITAVVASVCNACPEKGGRAAVALLSSQDLIEMDRARMVQDHYVNIGGFLPPHSAEAEIYEGERKKAAQLSHRSLDLEALAVKLQLGGQREKVWKILDDHRASLPPVENQSDKHRLWRLALHRMDIRGFRPVEPQPSSEGGTTAPKIQDAAMPEPPRVYYGPGVIEEDVQAIVDRHAPVRARQEEDMGLLFWGKSAWERDTRKEVDITVWQARLSEARERASKPQVDEDFMRDGPGLIASVCVRDHWEELTSAERDWCITKLVEEIELDCETVDDTIQHARGQIKADRAAAYVLPRVLSQTDFEESDIRLRRTIAKALTHAVSEVVEYAANGIGYYLQGNWRDFSMLCVSALVRQAQLITDLQAKQEGKPYKKQSRGAELIRSVVPDVRTFIEAGTHVDIELSSLNLDKWSDKMCARTMLQILQYHPQENFARIFNEYILEYIVNCWLAERRRPRSDARRDFKFEYESFERIAQFVLKLPASEALLLCGHLLDAVGNHPAEVAKFIDSLIIAEDRSTGKSPFWEIWQAFADRLCGASWVMDLDSRYASGIDLLNKMFLGLAWKTGVRHWKHLKGNASRIDELFNRLPVSRATLNAYSRFLHDIGERSLPNGFVIIGERFGDRLMKEVLDSNTVFYLESLLRRYVYGEPLMLKQNPRMRMAVLRVLDQLVEAGSSAAFRMRDDFVTPVGEPLRT